MQRLIAAFSLTIALATPARADIPANVAELADALEWDAIIQILHEEGTNSGQGLAEDLFPSRSGAQWTANVERIYDRNRMTEISKQGFADALGDADTSGLTEFFNSELGQQIITLELTARRALMDEAIEEASKEHVQDMVAASDPRLDQLTEYIVINDLLENNVVGALNSNFAFFTGLAEGGGAQEGLTDEQILVEVWSQEAEIRSETEEWLYSYLALAYQPLSDEDLETYIAFSATEGGQALNHALFVGFDEMFEGISRALGLAAAGMMAGEDL